MLTGIKLILTKLKMCKSLEFNLTVEIFECFNNLYSKPKIKAIYVSSLILNLQNKKSLFLNVIKKLHLFFVYCCTGLHRSTINNCPCDNLRSVFVLVRTHQAKIDTMSSCISQNQTCT